MMENKDGIRIIKSYAFGIVPDALLTDKSLSLSARAVLSYMIGRPQGWVIRISHIRSVLGVSDTVWTRIRKELISAGYLHIFKHTDNFGKIRWDISVANIPMHKSKSKSTSDTSIGNRMATSDSDSDSVKEA